MTKQEWMDYFKQHGFNARDLRQMQREMEARQDYYGEEWAQLHLNDLVTAYNYRVR